MLGLEEKIARAYDALGSVKAVAKDFGLSEQKVRKVLISLGIYESKRLDVISELVGQGYSVEEIAEMLKVRHSTVLGYLPYSKCIYNSESPTRNALNIRKFRVKKA